MARIDRVKKKAVDVEAVFQDRLSRVAQDTEALLERLLAPGPLDGERARPKRLLEAMRYASLGAGASRRLRRHGRRTTARPRSRRTVRRFRAEARRAGGQDAAGDEDRRAAALRMSCRRDSGKGRRKEARRAGALRFGGRRGVP